MADATYCTGQFTQDKKVIRHIFDYNTSVGAVSALEVNGDSCLIT